MIRQLPGEVFHRPLDVAVGAEQGRTGGRSQESAVVEIGVDRFSALFGVDAEEAPEAEFAVHGVGDFRIQRVDDVVHPPVGKGHFHGRRRVGIDLFPPAFRVAGSTERMNRRFL